ncbi:MAG: TIGR04086 family membrane protein [Clostridia bacterium]|nr:TIGR04086 family membrane protein [Clostridia bacterium]
MQEEQTTGNVFFRIIKGAGLALAFSFLCALVFASVLQCTPLPDKIIYPVNQTVKVVSIVIGALVSVRGEKGWLQGLAVGGLFAAFSYLSFSALGGDFSLSWLVLAELALSLFAGAVGGVVAVNLKRE